MSVYATLFWLIKHKLEVLLRKVWKVSEEIFDFLRRWTVLLTFILYPLFFPTWNKAMITKALVLLAFSQGKTKSSQDYYYFHPFIWLVNNKYLTDFFKKCWHLNILKHKCCSPWLILAVIWKYGDKSRVWSLDHDL